MTRWTIEFWQRPWQDRDGVWRSKPVTRIVPPYEVVDVLKIAEDYPYIPMYITIWFES